MTKRAVVVGVNDYSVQGANNLSWCVRDAQSFYHLLVEAFGFEASSVYLYTDAAASNSNITRALAYLVRISQPGDTICFYFAGHGSRVASTNATDVDKYYECIIPHSGSWLSDWDLYRLADQLQPSWVNFTVVLDSCHSGGMHSSDDVQKTRGLQTAQSLLDSMVQHLTTLIPCGLLLPFDSDACNNNVSNVRASSTGLLDLDEDPNKTLISQSKSTLLSACKFTETAQEDGSLRHGLFTQSFLDIVNTSNFTISNNDLHNRLVTRVGHYMNTKFPGETQTPQLRGQESRVDENFLEGFNTSE